MSPDGNPAQAEREARRDRGANAAETARQRLIEALARRVENHDGLSRELLEARLAALRQANGDAAAADGDDADADTPARGALADLLAELAQPRAARAELAGDGGTAADHYPRLAMLPEFRQLWARLRSESQLRESLAPAPADTGPLNSSRLVHRALGLMRETSPAYLQSFLSYLDVLTWLEPLHALAAPPAAEESPVAGARKRTRKRRG